MSGPGGSGDPDLEAAIAATPSPIPAAPPVLRPGASGDSVIALQRSLNDWRSMRGAAPVSTDGSYGPSTVTAVKDLQKAKGLGQDGVVGPGTWKALADDISPIVAKAIDGFSPAGIYALSGDDPAHGSFTGQVAISALRDPARVRVRYSAAYADGADGTISGIGRLTSHYLSLYIPIETGGGAGVFSREASASRDAAFHLDYDFDPRIGSATGSTHIAVAGKAGQKSTEAIARASHDTTAIADAASRIASGGAEGVADVVRKIDPVVGDVFTAVAMPLGPFSGVVLPAAPALKLSSEGDNRMHLSVALKDGASPRVSIWFDRAITVTGPFPMPHAELLSIWFDGDRVQTDAHFHVPLLDMIPGLSRLPGDLASQIASETAGGFAPLMQLLHARAQAGQLPDAEAIGAALVGTPDAPLPEGLEPVAASLDKSQVSGSGEMTLKKEIRAEAPNGSTAIAGEGTKIKAEITIDLVAGRTGELGLMFDPPVHIHSPEAGAWLVMPSMRSMKISPEGGVAIEAGSFMNIGLNVVQREADIEAKRVEAFLQVLYAAIPKDSDLGKALRRAGIGPR